MKYYKELPNGYKEVYSIDAGNKKTGFILNLIGLPIMIVMFIILMISLPVIFFPFMLLVVLGNIYVSFLLIKYKEAFINDTGLKQTFYILDRKEDKLCVV